MYMRSSTTIYNEMRLTYFYALGLIRKTLYRQPLFHIPANFGMWSWTENLGSIEYSSPWINIFKFECTVDFGVFVRFEHKCRLYEEVDNFQVGAGVLQCFAKLVRLFLNKSVNKVRQRDFFRMIQGGAKYKYWTGEKADRHCRKTIVARRNHDLMSKNGQCLNISVARDICGGILNRERKNENGRFEMKLCSRWCKKRLESISNIVGIGH